MKTFFLLFLTACSGDTFTSLPASVIPPDLTPDAATDPDSSDPPDSQADSLEAAPADAAAEKLPACSDPNDVELNGACFYLDGSNGACDANYALGTNAQLAAVLKNNPNAWQGKNYRHAVSDSSCVLTADNVQNYGMVSHNNVPGPFGAGEPVASGAGCWMVSPPIRFPKQLTLCRKPGA